MDAGGVSIGATVGIIGCGPIAHLMIQVARMRGAAEIYCMHNNFNREASIIKAGATPVAAYDGDSMQRGNALFGEQGVDVAFEAVGKASTYSQSLKIVRPGGTVIAFGGCPPSSTIELDLNFIHYNAIRLIGSYHYPPGSFDAALALIAERSIDLDMIATETLPLSQIAQAPKIAKHPDCLSLTIVP
jgi:L-iditol 2-dehydrogenase